MLHGVWRGKHNFSVVFLIPFGIHPCIHGPFLRLLVGGDCSFHNLNSIIEVFACTMLRIVAWMASSLSLFLKHNNILYTVFLQILNSGLFLMFSVQGLNNCSLPPFTGLTSPKSKGDGSLLVPFYYYKQFNRTHNFYSTFENVIVLFFEVKPSNYIFFIHILLGSFLIGYCIPLDSKQIWRRQDLKPSFCCLSARLRVGLVWIWTTPLVKRQCS